MTRPKKLIKLGNFIFAIIIGLSLLIFPALPAYSTSHPTITKIITTQLHNENDPIHRYQLEVVVNNPSGERIEGFWQVDCGGLEQGKGLKVVLRYSGDCSNASVTVTVVNEQLYGQKLTQPIFIQGEKELFNIKPKTNQATEAATVSTAPSPSLTPSAVPSPQTSGTFTSNGIYLFVAVVLVFVAAILLALKKKGLLVLPILTEGAGGVCRLGDKRDCKFIGMKYSIFGRRPHEDEELDLFLDLSADAVNILKWLVSTKGTTPAIKLLPAFLRQMVALHKKINEIEKLRDGVDIWGTIQWEECERQGFWLWARNSWVVKTKDVKISPPLYPYQMNSRAWNPQYMLNQKFIFSNLKKILNYIRKKALEECPVGKKVQRSF